MQHIYTNYGIISSDPIFIVILQPGILLIKHSYIFL